MQLCSVVVLLCLLASVLCQTSHTNGNPTGEIGTPAFDEIIVESTLTVKGKSGSRSSKQLTTDKPQEKKKEEEKKEEKKEEKIEENKEEKKEENKEEGAKVVHRSKRVPRQRFHSPSQFDRFSAYHRPQSSHSSSAAQASSNAFQSQSPFGSFGASASQASSQSQQFGPNGFQGSAGQSGSQTYHLPNGNKIDLAYSAGFSHNNGRPSFSNSHSLTFTGPDGQKQVYQRS